MDVDENNIVHWYMSCISHLECKNGYVQQVVLIFWDWFVQRLKLPAFLWCSCLISCACLQYLNRLLAKIYDCFIPLNCLTGF
jgi:hypothetical protein